MLGLLSDGDACEKALFLMRPFILVNYLQIDSWVLLIIRLPSPRDQSRSHSSRQRTIHPLQRTLVQLAVASACTDDTIVWLEPVN